jgi:preprotein translocase subunit SecD
MQRIAAVVLVAMLQGCTLGPDTELALEVDSSDPAVVEETARVLAARFKEFRPTLLSSAELAIDGSKLRFTFKNGAPDPRILEYLYATRGRLRAAPPENRFGQPWFTDRDVRDVHVTYQDSMRVLTFRLTPEAGQRLLRLTTENIGEVMRMTLDGETMMEARIQGAFGERFLAQDRELDQDLYVALAVVLTTGALPADVSAAQ